MTEEDMFDEDLIDRLQSNGKVIGSQAWSNGSWSTVYEHAGKYYAVDEVELTECHSAEEAFRRANFGEQQHNKIDQQFIDPCFEQQV